MSAGKIYNACIYARLSRDDGDKVESDSITNQRALIRDFIAKHPEIRVASEKTDDGFSGTSFSRPSFERMMERIKKGELNLVIVKDFHQRSAGMRSRHASGVLQKGNWGYAPTSKKRQTTGRWNGGFLDFVYTKFLITT
ncbi:MAG: recombinase family protein [Lachnospiraceae bacterium]|nr:recombinase family protein [Lachnospiraceae bacterium]